MLPKISNKEIYRDRYLKKRSNESPLSESRPCSWPQARRKAITCGDDREHTQQVARGRIEPGVTELKLSALSHWEILPSGEDKE